MLQGMRLRLLGLFVGATFPFVALVAAGLWQQWEGEKRLAMQAALSEARATAALVDDYISNLESAIVGLSYAVSANPADAEQNDILFVRAKAALPDYIANLTLFAPDGANIGIAEGNRFSAADRLFFRKVLAGESLGIGEPVLGRAGGRRVVTIARPIHDAAGKLDAVIAIGTSLEKFQRKLTEKVVPGTVIRLVGENNMVMSEWISGSNELGRNLVQFEDGVLHPAPPETAQIARWSDGIERITGSARSERTNWLVAVGLPTEVVFAPIKTRMVWSALSCLAALFVTLAIAWIISSRTVRPLRELARDASTLAKGDLGHRTAVQSSDEIGQLASAFNRMASALELREDEAQRTAEEVRSAKDTLAAVVDASPIAIACTGLDRRIMLWNRAAEQIYGITGEEAVGQAVKIVPPEDVTESRALLQRAFNGETIRDVDVKRLRKSGTLVDVRLAVAPMYNPDGSVRGVAWAHEDITDRKRAEEQLRRFAHYDQLTGLPNRLKMRTELEALLASDWPQAPVTIALFDLDGFKDVNDTLGHSTGDRLLIEVGNRLTKIAEQQAPPSQVCRLGGDEFVVIMPTCGDPRVAADAVRAMLHVLADPIELGGHVLHLAGSAGIAMAPNDGQTVDDLIANADLALYAAKKNGGGAYRFFVPSLRAKAQSRRALEGELRQAFARDEFELFYQPQVKLAPRHVVGAEALLRWRHPDRGLLNPGLFIDALADNPIAPDVGRWIMRTACIQAARWREQGYPLDRIAVNLFSAQLHDPALIDDVETILRDSGLPAHALELEITEHVALNNEALVMPLRRLHEKGVKLAFDDFGTGFASLSYLRLFPISHIKIDRSFVEKIVNGAQDAAIVRSLIAMAHSLELEVIAEGVETEAQAAFLTAEKCDEGQGFLFAEPLPASDFGTYLQAACFSAETFVESRGAMSAAGARSIDPPRRREKMR